MDEAEEKENELTSKIWKEKKKKIISKDNKKEMKKKK